MLPKSGRTTSSADCALPAGRDTQVVRAIRRMAPVWVVTVAAVTLASVTAAIAAAGPTSAITLGRIAGQRVRPGHVAPASAPATRPSSPAAGRSPTPIATSPEWRPARCAPSEPREDALQSPSIPTDVWAVSRRLLRLRPVDPRLEARYPWTRRFARCSPSPSRRRPRLWDRCRRGTSAGRESSPADRLRATA